MVNPARAFREEFTENVRPKLSFEGGNDEIVIR